MSDNNNNGRSVPLFGDVINDISSTLNMSPVKTTPVIHRTCTSDINIRLDRQDLMLMSIYIHTMYTEKFTKRPEREIYTMITYRGERIHQISTPCEIYIVSTAVNVNFPLCAINTHAHSARSTFTSCISSIYVCTVTSVKPARGDTIYF